MSKPPPRQKVYHITHVDNLASILERKGLLSDDQVIQRRHDLTNIGMTEIKKRRLELEVSCHPGTTVGQYVPFYFCPRSVMLYIISRANHPDLAYQGGQRPIVHLEFDLNRVVEWAEAEEHHWAFSTSNAGARYARFFNNRRDFTEIDWDAVAARDFRDPTVQERKQAELLVFGLVPWSLVERIGTLDGSTSNRVESSMEHAVHRPAVKVRRNWYY